MKKQLFILVILLAANSIFAQTNEEFKPNGNAHFKVFWNYHADFTEDADKKSAFEIKRSYLGYKYNFNKNMSAKITFDVGSNSAGSGYTAFLKIAQLDWKVSPITKLSMGLIGNKQFKDQENNWGYRYLFKSFQDQNKFGSSADLGVNAEFKLSEKLTANFLIFNGEGYKKLQDDNGNQRFGSSLIYKLTKGITTKIYVDAYPTNSEETMLNISLFAGYGNDKFKIGAEYNQLKNGEKYSTAATGKDLDGFSFYGTYILNPKFQIFGRYDKLNSNTLDGESDAWNFSKNGSQIVTGLQYAPIKGVKFALNYQGFQFDNSDLNNESLAYINVEFKL